MATEATRFNFHTSEILQYIKGELEDLTEVEVFCGDRPTNNSKQRKEMLVVSLPYSIKQYGAYQKTYLRIEIIVKDKTEGRSNLARLEELSNKVVGMFPFTHGRFICGSVPNLVLSGKDTIGYTIWNLQCSMLISKLDTYN